MYKLLTVGADPEVFFMTKDGKPQSVEGLLGGTKQEPRKLGTRAGFFVQEDNVAAEFNIPPASSGRQFSNNINYALKMLKGEAKKLNFDLAFVSSLHFPKEQLDTVHAQTLGCEPDFNVWLKEQNPRPVPPFSLRTAAGHVHVGWDDPSGPEREALLKMLDLYLGVPSIVATAKNARRELYGKAGACRGKEYGVEYRVLDNWWLEDHENREFVFDRVKAATEQIIKLGLGPAIEILDDIGEDIQLVINEHRKDHAIALMHKYQLAPFPLNAHA